MRKDNVEPPPTPLTPPTPIDCVACKAAPSPVALVTASAGKLGLCDFLITEVLREKHTHTHTYRAPPPPSSDKAPPPPGQRKWPVHLCWASDCCCTVGGGGGGEQATDIYQFEEIHILSFYLLISSLFHLLVAHRAVGGEAAHDGSGLQCFSAAESIPSPTCCLHPRFDLSCSCQSEQRRPYFCYRAAHTPPPLSQPPETVKKGSCANHSLCQYLWILDYIHLPPPPPPPPPPLFPPACSSSSSATAASLKMPARRTNERQTSGHALMPPPPTSPSTLWCEPWTFSITSSCETYEGEKGSEEETGRYCSVCVCVAALAHCGLASRLMCVGHMMVHREPFI